MIRVVQRPRHRHHRTRRRRVARATVVRVVGLGPSDGRVFPRFVGARGERSREDAREDARSARASFSSLLVLLLVVERAPRVVGDARRLYEPRSVGDARRRCVRHASGVRVVERNLARRRLAQDSARMRVDGARSAGRSARGMGRGVERVGDARRRVLARGRARRKIEMGALRANAEWFRCRRVAPVALERRGRA